MNGLRVRHLDLSPHGDKYLLIDPLGISEPVLVAPELLFLISLMDGTRSEEEIRKEFERRTGLSLPEEVFREAVESLNRNYMLLNETFYSKLRSLKESMLKKGIREPFHAGEAYPKEPGALTKLLESSLSSEDKESPIGILVPHMDIRVAIDTYGKVYGRLNIKPETVVILGVSHYPHETPFSACPLDLQTPLGKLEVDREVIESLREKFDYDIFHDILSYQREHSIEFQSLFVKLLFPETKVVPLIVSYGDEGLLKGIADKIASSLGYKEALIISSVDMSHVGKKFGDPSSYDPSSRDREYIGYLSELDSIGAFNLLKRDNNTTRIDGQFTNFVFTELMKTLGAKEGKEIDYQLYYEEPTDSIVSYAGMSFS